MNCLYRETLTKVSTIEKNIKAMTGICHHAYLIFIFLSKDNDRLRAEYRWFLIGNVASSVIPLQFAATISLTCSIMLLN